MQKYAIIKNGLVVNSIEYESPPNSPPFPFDDTYIAVQSDVAAPNWTYANGVFTRPQPYPSWTLVNNEWTPPVSHPSTTEPYSWNESTQTWIKVQL